MDSVNIYLQNVRGLGVKCLSPLGHLKLQYLFSKIPPVNSILILTEINLKDLDFKILKIKIPKHFKILNANFNGRGHGTLAIASSDFCRMNTPLITSTVVKGRISHFQLKGGDDKIMTFYSCYLSHKNNHALRELQALREHIDRYYDGNSSIFILGDFNFDSQAHPEHDQRETILNQICTRINAFDMARFFDKARPTWHGPGARGLQKSSRIDRVYSSVPDLFSSFSILGNPYSDHETIILSNVKKEYSKPPPRWSNQLFLDEDFEAEARNLVCRTLIENSLYDISEIMPTQWTDCRFVDNNLIFPASGDLRLIPVYSLVMSKLLELNSKRAREKFMRIKYLIRSFEKTYDDLFLSYLETPTLDIVNQLDSLKREFRNEFSYMMQNKQEIQYISNLYADGKSNINTYRKFKSKKKIAHKLVIDEKVITDPEELIEIFSRHHKEVTASNVIKRDNFVEFEEFFQLPIDSIFPEKYVVPDNLKLDEIKAALKSMSGSSSLGPSGQGKPIFSFFIKFFPNFFVDLSNEILNCEQIENTSLAYLKNRKIIFLPKAKDCKNVTDFRPISLLEFYYKILSKCLAKKVDDLLPTLVGPEQYGFIKGRRMSTASTSAFACLNMIRRKGQGILLCLDIKKAYDSVS